MKPILLVTLFATTILNSLGFAQDDDVFDAKPKEKYNGLTFNITGLINNINLSAPIDPTGNESFIYRMYLRDDLALRFGFGVNTVSSKTLRVDSVGAAQVRIDSTFKRADFFLAPAIEKHIETKNRLDPYLGAQFMFGVIGKNTITSNTQSSDTLGTATSNLNTQIDGGAMWGINLITGFNYFFADQLAIGAEYIFGFNSTTVGGDFTTVVVNTPVNGSPQTTNTSGTNITTNSGLGITSTAGITLSYFFAQQKKKKTKKKKRESEEG